MERTEHGWYDDQGRYLGFPNQAIEVVNPEYIRLIFWPPNTGLSVHVSIKRERVKDKDWEMIAAFKAKILSGSDEHVEPSS